MNEIVPTGYSGKPLSQKLGLKQSMRAIVIAPPPDYVLWLDNEADFISKKTKLPFDFVHLFVNALSELESYLFSLKDKINPDAMVWVSWYKKSAKKPTEITEDLIRDTCIPLGYVDVKVCAVSEEWSALKLVIRKELRKDLKPK